MNTAICTTIALSLLSLLVIQGCEKSKEMFHGEVVVNSGPELCPMHRTDAGMGIAFYKYTVTPTSSKQVSSIIKFPYEVTIMELFMKEYDLKVGDHAILIARENQAESELAPIKKP